MRASDVGESKPSCSTDCSLQLDPSIQNPKPKRSKRGGGDDDPCPLCSSRGSRRAVPLLRVFSVHTPLGSYVVIHKETHVHSRSQPAPTECLVLVSDGKRKNKKKRRGGGRVVPLLLPKGESCISCFILHTHISSIAVEWQKQTDVPSSHLMIHR